MGEGKERIQEMSTPKKPKTSEVADLQNDVKILTDGLNALRARVELLIEMNNMERRGSLDRIAHFERMMSERLFALHTKVERLETMQKAVQSTRDLMREIKKARLHRVHRIKQ